MLAKSDSNKTEVLHDEKEKFRKKIEELHEQITQLETELHDKNCEIINMKDVASIGEISRQQIESLNDTLSVMGKSLNEEQQQKSLLQAQVETLKNDIAISDDSLAQVKIKLEQFEESFKLLMSENEKIKQSQQDATLFHGNRVRELTHLLNEEKDKNVILNVQLQEKDGKIDRIQSDLLAAESHRQQSENDIDLTKPHTEALKNFELNVKILREELLETKENLKKKDSNLKMLEDEFGETRAELQIKISKLQAECESEKTRYNQLLEAQSSETKSSGNDEITTLLSSLDFRHEDNNQFEMTVHGLHDEIKHLRDNLNDQKETISYWQERANKSDSDLQIQLQRIMEIETTKNIECEKLKNEKLNCEEGLQKAFKQNEKTNREALENISQIKREMTEASIVSDRMNQALQEKINSLTRELEYFKKRAEDIQDEQCKLISSHNEDKTTLMNDLQNSHQEKKSLETNYEHLQSANDSLTRDLLSAKEISDSFRMELEIAEKTIETTRMQLQTAEEIANRLQEAEIINGSFESQIGKFQSENKTREEQIIIKHQLTLEILQDELDKSKMEQKSIKTILEDQQIECKYLHNQIKEQELRCTNLTAKLVQSENLRECLERDREKLNLKHDATLGKNIELAIDLSELTKINKQLETDFEQLSSLLKKTTTDKTKLEEETTILRKLVVGEKANINEISAENSHLISEVLRFHSTVEKSLNEERNRITKQFEERLMNTPHRSRKRLERVSATKEKARKSPGENSEKSSSGENPKGFRELTLQRVTTEFDTHVVS
uniref:Uncharacterized protein n=1 Tax=Caenorhabditis japonica TaxID=281687 RepID=A0A8R1DF47_CAEJA